MTNKLVAIDAPELSVIEKSKADQIKGTFAPMAEMLEGFEAEYSAVISKAESGITKEITTEAKRLRVAISKVRISTEKARKEQKEEYLRAGKAIDGVSNILKWAVSDKEQKLKEIENYYEIQEKNRLEQLQKTRADRLSEYVEDAHERDLAKFADDEFEALFVMKKNEHDEKIKAEKIAEQERIAREKAEAEEREKMRQENERLKKEAEERERLEAEERKKREKLEAELEERKKAELRAKEKEEQRIAKEKAEAEAKIQDELKKGDSEKVNDLLVDLKSLQKKYEFKSSKNKKMYSDVCSLLEKIVNHVKQGEQQ